MHIVVANLDIIVRSKWPSPEMGEATARTSRISQSTCIRVFRCGMDERRRVQECTGIEVEKITRELLL